MVSLEKILELTEAVEQHVERGEWSEAGRLDGERCQLLAELLADDSPARSQPGLRAAVEQLLLRNRLTVARAETRRAELMDESARFERHARAAHSYRRNTGSGAQIGTLALLRTPQVDKS